MDGVVPTLLLHDLVGVLLQLLDPLDGLVYLLLALVQVLLEGVVLVGVEDLVLLALEVPVLIYRYLPLFSYPKCRSRSYGV